LKDGDHEGVGGIRKLHDPVEDKLVPIHPLDLGQVKTVNDLVRSMGETAFTGRQVGEAADVLEAMARDRDCFVVMTLAGALTVAKQGLIVTELIDRDVVNALVSTGALMAHGLVEATGRSHFRYDPSVSDVELYDAGYNRVYDTLEPERNLDDVEAVVFDVLKQWDAKEILCSWKLNRAIGEYLVKHAEGRGILKSACQKNVPVFVPAFTDSELGLDFALTNRIRTRDGQPRLRFDPFEDLEHFAETLLAQKRLGILTIGGGLLGRAVGESLHRGGFVGEVRASGRRRSFRRSVSGCHGGIALDRGGGAGEAAIGTQH
jgi:deoxyhypusine synthase